MKKIINIILNLSLASILALVLSIIIFTISEFIGIDLKIDETSSYFAFSYLFSFAVFIATLIVWMKFKSQVTLILFILIIGGLYGIGSIYAHKIIKPFKKAEEYRKEAYSIYDKWQNETIKTDEINEYLKDQNSALTLLKSSTKLNFGYENWIQKYYQTIYEVKKEIYEQDKKSFSGKQILSEEELNELYNTYTKKLQENFYIKPLWMSFYAVDPT